MINIVYNEPNINVMKRLEDKIITLAYEDPPYGIGESKKNHKSRNTLITQKNGNKLKAKDRNYIQEDWDNKPPSDEYFNELFRISRNQFIWGANYFKQIVGTPFNPPRRNEFQDFIKKYPIGWVIWDKLNGSNDFNDCELAWTNSDKPTVIIPYLWAGMMQGISIQYGNIQRGDKSQNEKRFHPTQKPMPINEWVIKNFISEDMINPIVFDGGTGSGGSRIVCYNFNVTFIGCETSKQMFDLQDQRFFNHIRKLRLQF